MLHLVQFRAQLRVAPLQPGDLGIHRVDLSFQLHDRGTADRIAGAGLARGNARLQRLDLALDPLHVGMIGAVAFPSLRQNRPLGLQLRRQ